MAEVSKEIVAAKEKAEAKLLKLPGVTGVDIGYKEVGGKPTNIIAIRVLVEKKKPDPAPSEKIPEEIDGHPTDVIERKFELHQFRARKAVTELIPEADTGTYTPLKGGISIGPCRAVNGFVYAGTLGAIVRDNQSGKHMLLSNFHVMCVDNNFHVGDTQAQPSLVDGGACPAGVVGTLARQSLGGSVDCAVADISGNRGESCEIVEIGTVTGTNTASLGQAVRKRGRTTGLTYGLVDSISLSVNIDYGPGIGVKTLTNQIGVKPDTAHNPKFGDHGDSGSVVVNNAREVLGLHFAGDPTGYGIANPIAAVLSALNVSVCTGVVKHKEFLKNEKLEIKEHKLEKIEHKDTKFEKLEKLEIKEFSKLEHAEKPIGKEKDGKELKEGGFEGPGGPGGPGDPGPFAGSKTAEIKKIEKREDKDFKELKTEKPESKDHKDVKHEKIEKNEAKDVKDHKAEKLEKNESKDHKDAKNEKVEKREKFEKVEKLERKELTKLEHPEKPTGKEKDGKELKEGGFEGPGGPGDPGPFAGSKVGEGKKLEIPEKLPKLEKVEKHEIKDFKEAKIEKFEGKDHKDIKHEKLEKNEAKDAKNESKDHKDAKHEKHEKHEKPEKVEKIESKDVTKHEQPEKPTGKEKDGKELKEGGFEGPGGPGDPGPIEQRVAAIEQMLAQLSHFIGASQRPDLAYGALTGEKDLADQSAALAGQAADAKSRKDAKDAEKLTDR